MKQAGSDALVLQIFVSDDVGGCEMVSLELLERLAERRPVLALCPRGEFSGRLEARGITRKQVESLRRLHRNSTRVKGWIDGILFLGRFFRASFEIAPILLACRPGCVQVVNPNAGARVLGALLLARSVLRPWLGPIPWILVNHNARRVFGGDRFFEAMCAAAFGELVAVSEAAKQLYPAAHRPRVRVIRNGVDVERFRFEPARRERFRSGHRLHPGSVAVGILGRISEAKGQALAARALALLVERHPEADVSLFICGEALPEDRDYRTRLERYISEAGLESRVFFLGRRDDVADLLPGLDVVLNASLPEVSESMGLTLVEGMACSRIVVGPDTGGVPEVICDGEDGFLFRPGDPEDLARVLGMIVGAMESLDPVRQRAREKAVASYSLDRMVAEYADLYDSISTGGPGRSMVF